MKKETSVQKMVTNTAAFSSDSAVAIFCAYGETLASQMASKAIPSEASGSTAECTEEPLERRGASSTSSNHPHECPATLWVEDVRRSSEKSESRDNNLGEDIATA